MCNKAAARGDVLEGQPFAKNGRFLGWIPAPALRKGQVLVLQ